MNRRGFLGMLGVGSAAVAATIAGFPLKLLQPEPRIDSSEDGKDAIYGIDPAGIHGGELRLIGPQGNLVSRRMFAPVNITHGDKLVLTWTVQIR